MSWPTKYKVLTSWKDNHLSSLCSSHTLKESENMFSPQTAWPFHRRSFFTFTHWSGRVFHSTKSLSWIPTCPWWPKLARQYVANGCYLGCWSAGIATPVVERMEKIRPLHGPRRANHLSLMEGGIEQKSIFTSNNPRRRNLLELFLPWIGS